MIGGFRRAARAGFKRFQTVKRVFSDKPKFEHYRLLELEQGITDAKELKKAFKLMAKKYHPDRNPDFKEKFVKILEAYKLISKDLKKSKGSQNQHNGDLNTQDDDDPLFNEDEIKDDPLYKWLNKIYSETDQEKLEREIEERKKHSLEQELQESEKSKDETRTIEYTIGG